MFDTLAEGFRKATDALRGQTSLNASNIAPAVDEIRRSLLEADVAYEVVAGFLEAVKTKALGQTLPVKAGAGGQKVRLGAREHFVRICHEELTSLMGAADARMELPRQGARILMVGLQGSGKTTSTAKLASFLQRQDKRRSLLVGADLYRPAAAAQLRTLAGRLEMPFYHEAGASALDNCKGALAEAERVGADTILFDTAGRLTIDAKLMDELKAIVAATNPHEILLVVDGMMGQDAVETARAFHAALNITGVILTKLDGDARGGAALSVRRISQAPIRFIGVGEGLDRLEEFRPEGLAGRILGMGDVLSLIDDFERVSEEADRSAAMRMLEGAFNFKDFYAQLAMIQRMGPMQEVLAKLPLGPGMPKDVITDAKIKEIKSIIDSMTERERLRPSLLSDSRIRRIAGGSGRTVRQVQDLIKQFQSMRQVLNQLKQGPGGLMGMMGKMFSGGFDPGALLGNLGMPGMGMGPSARAPMPVRVVDRDKLRKARKQARQNRKKARK